MKEKFSSVSRNKTKFSRQIIFLFCLGLVIPGYCVEGTLAKEVQKEPTTIDTMSQHKKALNMSVHYIRFAAHADWNQTKDFVSQVKPQHIVCKKARKSRGRHFVCFADSCSWREK